MQFTETSIVQPIDDIIKSVYQAIDNLAGNEAENIQKAKTLKSELARYDDSPENFLAAMKTLIPDYILSLKGGIYDIQSKCIRLGYKIK